MVRKLRKGFTLVELLIVIVIIGILAAAMLLSSGSASDSAVAAKIISDLRNLKAADMMWQIDSGDEARDRTIQAGVILNNIYRYIDNPQNFTGAGTNLNAPVISGIYMDHTERGVWAFVCNLRGVTKGVREKLAGRAASVGLYETVNAASLNPYDGTRSELMYVFRSSLIQ